MRKIANILIILIVLMMLSACSTPTQDYNITMTINPTNLSDETLTALEFVSEEAAFFDFIVDDTIKSYAVEAWIFEGGEWKSYGGTSVNIDAHSNKIAINPKGDGYNIMTSDDSGFISYLSDEVYSEFSNTTQIGTYKLTNSTPILKDTEITLWSKIGNNENGMSTNKEFRNADCSAGMAFTIVFSEEKIK